MESEEKKVCHTKNKLSWQAYGYMSVCLEIKATGKDLRGKKLTAKDKAELDAQIESCTEVLNKFGCALPVYEVKVEPKQQLELF